MKSRRQQFRRTDFAAVSRCACGADTDERFMGQQFRLGVREFAEGGKGFAERDFNAFGQAAYFFHRGARLRLSFMSLRICRGEADRNTLNRFLEAYYNENAPQASAYAVYDMGARRRKDNCQSRLCQNSQAMRRPCLPQHARWCWIISPNFPAFQILRTATILPATWVWTALRERM